MSDEAFKDPQHLAKTADAMGKVCNTKGWQTSTASYHFAVRDTVRSQAARIATLEAQLAEAVEALEDVVNPLRYLQRAAEADGCQLSGRAYEVANSVHTARDIARAALGKLGGKE